MKKRAVKEITKKSSNKWIWIIVILAILLICAVFYLDSKSVTGDAITGYAVAPESPVRDLPTPNIIFDPAKSESPRSVCIQGIPCTSGLIVTSNIPRAGLDLFIYEFWWRYYDTSSNAIEKHCGTWAGTGCTGNWSSSIIKADADGIQILSGNLGYTHFEPYPQLFNTSNNKKLSSVTVWARAWKKESTTGVWHRSNWSNSHNILIFQPYVDTIAPAIAESGPSGTIITNSVTLTATTNENASCKFSNQDVTYDSMTLFANTGAESHSQTLTLANGNYNYYIKCKDLKGNVNESNPSLITFTINAPIPEPNCTDSDNKLDYYNLGSLTIINTTGGISTESDSCIDENTLSEQYCSGVLAKNIGFTCPNGCLNGACINVTTPPETPSTSCIISPGCSASAINNSHNVSGTCANTGELCYSCDSGYAWDGLECAAANTVEECKGCMYNETCLTLGFRLSNTESINQPVYCSSDHTFIVQKATNSTCQNNHECSTNLCSNNKCVDIVKKIDDQTSLLWRVLCWITNPTNPSNQAACEASHAG